MHHHPSITVTTEPASDAVLAQRARDVRAALDLPEHVDDPQLSLVVTPQGLELRVLRGEPDMVRSRPMRVDWSLVDVASGPGRSLKQPLARALGLRHKGAQRVIDATGGWGEDSYLLARLGCDVLTIERSSVMALMLREELAKIVQSVPELSERLHVICGDSSEVLRDLPRVLPQALQRFAVPQVIYLDPMFPGARKTAERKEMRLLRMVVGEDADAGSLLAAALAVGPDRVVVKRPRHAKVLPGPEPTVTHEGKAIRFDVYARI